MLKMYPAFTPFPVPLFHMFFQTYKLSAKLFTMLFIIFLLSVILFYKLFHSLTQNNSQNNDSILMSLTSKVKSIKKNQLDSKASLITIVDDESDKVHFSISVNTNGMSNDVINEGYINKENVFYSEVRSA